MEQEMNTTILALDLGTQYRLGTAAPGRNDHEWHRAVQAAALRGRWHALPAFQALADRVAQQPPMTSTRCTSRKSVGMRASMPRTPTAASWATSPPGASTTSIPYQGVPVGTIKKHATGKGNAGKDEMIASVTSAWPPSWSTTTKPMRWPSCTGRSRRRRCEMKMHDPFLPLPLGSPAARAAPIRSRSSSRAGATNRSS